MSGGADSLALALLAKAWGDPVAFIVDHGLRAGSAAEADHTRIVLSGRGISARVLRLDHLRAGPGVAARARAARYATLSAACREAGLVDLLVGHHAGDQAETVLMRQRSGSGPAGLAGMAALATYDDVRVLRPLLGVDPVHLRALVAAAGLIPVEDPTNTDLRTTRAQLRLEIGVDRVALLATAVAAGKARAESEATAAGELAVRAQIHPEGFAVLSPGPIGPRSLAALIRSLSGRRFPVRDAASLAAYPRAATLGGVQVQPAGRLGPGWLLVREAAAMDDPVTAVRDTIWDGRFGMTIATPGTLGPLGASASRLRQFSDLPFAVLQTLPALRINSLLSDVPHLDYHAGDAAVTTGVIRHACLPAAGASFFAS